MLFHSDRALNAPPATGSGCGPSVVRRRILFIVNPTAGAGKSGPQWTSFKTLLNRDHVDFKEAISERPGHAYQLARNFAGDYELLVAVGGDGTVREVVDGIMSAKKEHVALAVVPFGTGNDLAQVLGIRTESDAVRTIKAGVVRSIDVIQISCQAEGETRPNICARMVRSPAPPPNGGEGRGEEALELQPSDLRTGHPEVPGPGVMRHALLFAGVGVIAAALRKTTPSFKRVFGQRLAYPFGLVAALLDTGPSACASPSMEPPSKKIFCSLAPATLKLPEEECASRREP